MLTHAAHISIFRVESLYDLTTTNRPVSMLGHRGDIGLVEFLLSLVAAANSGKDGHIRPLLNCVLMNNVTCARLLIVFGADRDVTYQIKIIATLGIRAGRWPRLPEGVPVGRCWICWKGIAGEGLPSRGNCYKILYTVSQLWKPYGRNEKTCRLCTLFG